MNILRSHINRVGSKGIVVRKDAAVGTKSEGMKALMGIVGLGVIGTLGAVVAFRAESRLG